MTVRFRLFGAIGAAVDDHPIELGHAQLRGTLAILLVDAHQSVTADQLIDRIWADGRLPRDPRRALHHNIWQLRQKLAVTPDVTLIRTRAGYRLSVDPATVDVHRFHALVARANTATNDQQAGELLEQALSLWSGEPFADLDIDNAWLHHQRAALNAQHHAARLDLTDIHLRQGHHSSLLAQLAADTTQHPLDERLAGQYLLALYRSGRQAQALDHYRRLQRRFAEELGADPSQPLQQLHQQILTADATLTVPSHRVPDHGVTTAMFSMRADIPTFTGRDTELDALLDTVVATLSEPDRERADGEGSETGREARAIAIHAVDGMPGVGKTTFSVHAAHHLAHRFPDGNIFLDLHGHHPGRHPLSPGAALESLLRAAGVDPQQIPSAVDDRARLWRDRLAGKKVLLVLDDAVDHEQIRPLLPGTAGNLVLITSRHRLAALDGVTPLTLDVLPADQAFALLVRLAGRTVAAGGGDEAWLAHIVASCGYLPLAITLAGALLRNHPTWSFAYLADLLAIEHERLEHLDVGDRSVRAAFDMSFQHRPAAQRRLFRLLGIHPGPHIDAYAAAALADCSVRDAGHDLSGLHAGHLVEETAPGRYRLHDLLRVYARTLATGLDPNEHRHALDRMLTYYLHTVQAANNHLPALRSSPARSVGTAPPQAPRLDDHSSARAWLDTELPTLTACVQLAAQGDHQKRAVDLANALQVFLHLQMFTDRALGIHQTALTVAREINDKEAEAAALLNLSDMQYERDEYAAATDSLTRAHDLYVALDNRSGQAATLTNIGRVQYLQDEYAAATDNLTRAHDLYVALDDRLGQAYAVAALSRVQHQCGEYAAATQNLTRGLDLYIAIGNQRGQAQAFVNLGRVQSLCGEYAAATRNLTRGLGLFATLGDPSQYAFALLDLSALECRQGNYAAAREHHTRALEVFIAIGDRFGQAYAHFELARLECVRGEYSAATERYLKIMDTFTELGHSLGQANALTHLGRVLRALGSHAAAAEHLNRALGLFATVGDPDGQAETLNNMGDLALDYPEAGDPYSYFSRALTMAQRIGTKYHEAHALTGQARFFLSVANSTQAVTLLRRAHSLCRALGVPEAVEIETMLSALNALGIRQPDQPAES